LFGARRRAKQREGHEIQISVIPPFGPQGNCGRHPGGKSGQVDGVPAQAPEIPIVPDNGTTTRIQQP
jgi:hypothetical protein